MQRIELGTVSFFRFIDLSRKELDLIPDVLFDFGEVEELHLEHNQIREIPEAVKRLSELR